MSKLGVSTRFSLQGWDWRTWLKGNKEMVKIVVSLGVALATQSGLVEGAVVAIVSKALLDIVDFYASEVRL